MRTLIKILFISLVSYLVKDYGPWWLIAVAGFIAGATLKESGGRSFIAGFAAIFVLWTALSYNQSAYGDHLLAERITDLFSVGSRLVLLLITGILGGLVAGFGTLAGTSLRDVID
jgi:hypothetical protein